MKLRIKLTLANLLFKTLFISIFVVATPWLSQRINLYQSDNELIEKREAVIALIAEYGVEPFNSFPFGPAQPEPRCCGEPGLLPRMGRRQYPAFVCPLRCPIGLQSRWRLSHSGKRHGRLDGRF